MKGLALTLSMGFVVAFLIHQIPELFISHQMQTNVATTFEDVERGCNQEKNPGPLKATAMTGSSAKDTSHAK